MNVLFVSQCSGRALTETRRILDQFAERRGERSWHTPITWEGLKTVQKLLRSKARKNSAVACFWIRRDRNELFWIVGNARRFNTQGATPTNTTVRDLVRSRDENDWHHGEVIRLLAAMASLFHDFGKANAIFQQKLKKASNSRDAYRHEWISLRLFAALVGDAKDDRLWLQQLADRQSDLSDWQSRLQRDGIEDSLVSAPLQNLPPLARALGWLIVTHHRLPVPKGESALQEIREGQLNEIEKFITATWCGATQCATEADKRKCWKFDHGIPLDSEHWRKHAARVATALLRLDTSIDTDWLDHPQVIHLARLALILADHHYSSQPSQARYGDRDFQLYANTDKDRKLKQRLDEHLIGVEINASRIVRTLPRLVHALPRIARHRGLRRRTRNASFHWQNRAFDLAEGLRKKTEQQGFFGIDMASTGTGKTLANGRILYALASPQLGARFTLALGLRTLTLQTGDVYRERLDLDSEDLAVLVGGGAVRELHEQARPQTPFSESSESLLPEQTHVNFEGSLESGPLKKWLSKQPDSLLNAPVVACTIDHIMPAAEATRGGRQILPMLRLLTSDLVLDEIDDFDPADLHAVTRLVHWAGMLGSRVLLSSATLPPALVQGLFQAYCAGREAYQRSRGESGLSLNVCCAWFDEFTSQADDCGDVGSFREAHQRFVGHRIEKLHKQSIRRHARIIPIKNGDGNVEDACEALAETLRPVMHRMHRDNALTDPKTGKRLSIGLIRMANINPLVQTARQLVRRSPENDFELHLSVYHSQFPLLMRHTLEKRLDRLLHREDPHKLFRDAEIRELLDDPKCSRQDIMLVVLASPVAEVGRNHDYDWAIVEPSSMRAIIQLAGRVRRHRREDWDAVNLGLLSTNVKTLKGREIAFRRPGFETESFKLCTHQLKELLRDEEQQRIDATWRIRAPSLLCPESHLSDLEHAVLNDLMLGSDSQKQTPVAWWWESRAHLSGVLQEKHRFRAGSPTQGYWLLPDECNEGKLKLYRREENHNEPTACQNLCDYFDINLASYCYWWGISNDWNLLEDYAEEQGHEPKYCALRYMTVELPANGEESGWGYHPALGFSKRSG